MEIMKEATYSREGNDCWLTDYCFITRVDTGVYITTLVQTVQGGWTGERITSGTAEFKNYDDALECMKSIYSKWVKE